MIHPTSPWLQRLRGLTLACLCLLVLHPSPSLAAPISPELEQQVLEIIRTHPEVLVDTLRHYQELQAQQEQAQRLDRIFSQPDAVLSGSPVKGDPQGQIVLLELSDFQCPFCAASQVPLSQFLTQNPHVRLLYKNFPLTNIHPQALDAARAAWAAQKQGKFWPYHDALFAHQNQLSAQLYPALAQSLGLNVEQFNSDRNSQAALTHIQTDATLGQQLGIEGTPLFVFYNLTTRKGQYLYGARNASDFENAWKAVGGS